MLKGISLRNIPEEKQDTFPWSLPLVKGLGQLTLNQPITFFVGENGSGKSTIIEALAAALHLPTAGSSAIDEDPSMEAARSLGQYLSLSWSPKLHHGFFTRSEDFIGFARRIKSEIASLEQEIEEIKLSLDGKGDLKLAVGAIKGEKEALISRYTADMEAMSHGEGFLKLFNARITARGIYLIDEPEAALSPARQLALISLIMDKVKHQECQFIIATHSPIIMATPSSEIWHFANDTISPIIYEDTQHYKITKQFLEDPTAFIRHL